MSKYLYTEEGGIRLREDGAPMLSEDAIIAAEFDFVTPFFVNNPFAVSAILIPPAGGKAVEIQAIFNSPNADAQILGMSFNSSKPSCLCQTADVDAVDDTYSIYIKSCQYFVKENTPDGTGISTLILTKDPIQ